MRSTVLACAILAVSLCSGTVSAQKDKFNKAAAQTAYRAAEQAEKKKDWKTAAQQFGVAYDISRDPILFYKIATAFMNDGNCEFAIVYFKRFTRDTKPSASHQTAERHVKTCQKKLGIKDEPKTSDTKIAPSAGTDTGKDADTDTGTGVDDPGAGGGTVGLTGASGYSETDREPSTMETSAWVSLGLAVALGATGAVFAITADDREADVSALSGFRDEFGLPKRFEGEIASRYNDKLDEGNSYDGIAKAAFGAAGVAAVAGLVLFTLDGMSGDDGDEEPKAKTTIAPTISTDGVGLAAGWEF